MTPIVMPPVWRAIFQEIIRQWQQDFPECPYTPGEHEATLLKHFCQQEVIVQLSDGSYRFPSLRDAAAILGEDR